MMFLGREVGRSQDFSEATAQAIDSEVGALVRAAYEEARDILQTHRDRVDALVNLLLEQETVDGPDAEDLIRLGRIRSPEEREPDEPVESTETVSPADLAAASAVPAVPEVPAATDDPPVPPPAEPPAPPPA
ncbi:MAG: hypothetical protein GX590_03720, partial [Lentisphaerae bacterium]|nr:hypothetical protein [Lentisphaerota bacterium]